MKPTNSQRDAIRIVLFLAGGLFSLSPWSTSASALVLGVLLAISLGNPAPDQLKRLAGRLLAFSIVGLGAGMNLATVSQAGISGLSYTVFSITGTLALGFLLGKALRVDSEPSTLISVGTAICGGSAIAAVGPVIGAKSDSMTIALGTVFLLNSAALVFFPPIGHHLGLSQPQFGLWSALAIHDTSSVVGAGLQYGAEALRIGTTVKLARALWIVPVTIAFGLYHHSHQSQPLALVKKLWFILGFLVVAGVMTANPAIQPLGISIEWIARKCLVLTLFLIGSNLTLPTLKAVGLRPFLQGILLWACVSAFTLGAILLS